MRAKVLLAKPKVPPAYWERFCQYIEPMELKSGHTYSAEELSAALQDCRGLIKMGASLPDLTRRVFKAAPALQLVGIDGDRFGTGVDMEAAAEHGVKVVDVSNIAPANPVAEWNLALILMCLRNVGTLFRQMMEGSEKWATSPNQDFVNGELTGRKIGLIGCGHIGQRLIELLAPFQVDLLVHDPYLDAESVARLGIVRDELDRVLEHAEILVVQVPHTEKTEKMIAVRELELLGKGSILINCSRGQVIDQQALIHKVESGELIAGLDVFEEEPLPQDSPLRALRNIFISPHVAWYAPDSLHLYQSYMLDEFARFFTGEPLRYELTRRMLDIRHGRV